jgi:mannose-6-phosphate isomerase-like protein (cupin superfamily)
MNKVINIEKCFEKFNDTFSPKIIAELNRQYVMVVKLEGDKVPWHIHENEDEMFYVLEGVLDIYEKDKQVTVEAGEFYIVNKGIEHRVIPQNKVKLMLFEPVEIQHTGSVKSEITKSNFEKLNI